MTTSIRAATSLQRNLCVLANIGASHERVNRPGAWCKKHVIGHGGEGLCRVRSWSDCGPENRGSERCCFDDVRLAGWKTRTSWPSLADWQSANRVVILPRLRARPLEANEVRFFLPRRPSSAANGQTNERKSPLSRIVGHFNVRVLLSP